MLEANFASEEATVALERVRCDHPFRALQLVCRADPDVLLERYLARSADRHRCHLDHERADDVRAAATRSHLLDVPGDVFEFDTTDFGAVDVGAILEDVRAWTRPSE